KPASRSEVSTCRPDDVAVVQALELLNGREFHEYVYSPDTLGKLVETMKPNAAIETIYLAVLERLPTPEERQLAAAFLAEAEKFMPAPGDAPPERVWFDDDTPPNATLNGSNGSQSWEWASAPDAPVLSGKRSHRQRGSAPTSQHHFLASGNP